jgi:hypothetical protein
MPKSISLELLSEWDTTANGDLDPANYSHGSTKIVWWICSKDKTHKWQAKINNRSNGTGCPYCKGKKPSKNRSVACIPHLILEWHSKNTLKPEEILPSSNIKVWWQCTKAKDHEWLASPNRRTAMQSGCPYCKGIAISKSNCLATTHPELISSWHKKNKISPYEVTHGSTKKVWWRCELCNHTYESYIYSRSSGHGCPKCRISKGEKKIKEFLERSDLSFQMQYRIKECKRKKPLPFDFAVFVANKTILIEFQGELHYHAARYNGGKEKLAKIQNSDKIKREYCAANSLQLIEIHYWQIDKIDEVLSTLIGEENE